MQQASPLGAEALAQKALPRKLMRSRHEVARRTAAGSPRYWHLTPVSSARGTRTPPATTRQSLGPPKDVDLSFGAREEEEAAAFAPRDLRKAYSPCCLHLDYLVLLVLAGVAVADSSPVSQLGTCSLTGWSQEETKVPPPPQR